MNILVIGSGGREHALAWKLHQSKRISKIICAPGNAGMRSVGSCIDVSPNDFKGLLQIAKEHKIDLAVVGPEAPLVNGIYEVFEAMGISIFGPTRYAAQLEGSKIFTKMFCRKYKIPTAEFDICTTPEEARMIIQKRPGRCVIKADGLAAGKGVTVCTDSKEAEETVRKIMLERQFGSAGDRIIIEDFLEGEEASIMAISDGSNFIVLESSQDHKAIFDGDKGPNTGGMGAYSPAPIVDPSVQKKTVEKIIGPVIEGMREEGHPFKGVLYTGIMISNGEPWLLEINVRFGDPETQPVLMRLNSDLLDVIEGSVQGVLNSVKLDWHKKAAVCVVVASGGYPGGYKKGYPIEGLESLETQKDTMIFHAGTQFIYGQLVTSGGRVLGVTSLGRDIVSARQRSYEVIQKIKFKDMYYRTDIAWRAMKPQGNDHEK